MLFGSHFFSKWKTSILFFDCVYLTLKMLSVKSKRWHRPLTIDCHTGSCYGISHFFGENLECQILALVSNVVLDSFPGCFTGLEKIPQESHKRLNRSCDLEGQCKSPKREMRRPGTLPSEYQLRLAECVPLLRLVGTTCPPVLIRPIVAEKTLRDDRLMANCVARRLVHVSGDSSTSLVTAVIFLAKWCSRAGHSWQRLVWCHNLQGWWPMGTLFEQSVSNGWGISDRIRAAPTPQTNCYAKK